MLKLAITIAIIAIQAYESLAGQNVVCYYTNWAQYRPGQGKYTPDNIDPFLCTHIIYAFAKISNGQLAAYEWNDENTDWSKGMFEKVTDWKKTNPSLKVMIAVGGWNMASTDFSNVVSSDSSRANFVSTAVTFLKNHKFDGLDIDWEYPSNREGSRPTDKQLFTKLCAELKAAFKPNNLILTIAVGVGKPTVDSAYEVAAVSQYVDFINLMTYDLHGSWESFTGHHSALYARSNENSEQKQLNDDFAVKYWMQLGAPSTKLHLGIPTYGRSFKIGSSTGLGASSSGPGLTGTFTREGGFVSYYEVCQYLANGYTKVFDNEQQVPYAYKSSDWVGYEDVQSAKIKGQYAAANNMAGIMFWALDLDDFSGSFCNQGKNPIITAAKSGLLGGSSGATSAPVTAAPVTAGPVTAGPITAAPVTAAPVTAGPVTQDGNTNTDTPTTTTATTTTTKKSGSDPCANGDGLYADVASGCQNYIQCVFSGTSNQQALVRPCPTGLIFDSKNKVCNWPSATTCP